MHFIYNTSIPEIDHNPVMSTFLIKLYIHHISYKLIVMSMQCNGRINENAFFLLYNLFPCTQYTCNKYEFLPFKTVIKSWPLRVKVRLRQYLKDVLREHSEPLVPLNPPFMFVLEEIHPQGCWSFQDLKLWNIMLSYNQFSQPIPSQSETGWINSFAWALW